MSIVASVIRPVLVLKGSLYGRVVLVLFGAMLIATTARLSGFALTEIQSDTLLDFHAFYIAARLVWQDRVHEAYEFMLMHAMQREYAPGDSFMPWSYPPPFNVVVAPLALLPIGLSYALFTAGTLAAYLVTLHRIAGPHFTPVVLATLPAFLVTIACGQNGFLSGTLIGLACLGLLHGRALAGLPLGLMVIKPHLAVGCALYTLLTLRWRTVFVAAATVAVACAGATALLGLKVWAGFFHGLHETRIFLEAGLYPLYRMVSPYAALRSLDVPAAFSLAVQAAVALWALALVAAAVRRRMAPSQQIGIAAIASLLVSPYAYDYDLTIYAIGLALVMPELVRSASRREQAAIFGLSFATCLWGLAKTKAMEIESGTTIAAGVHQSFSPAGLTLVLLVALVWRVLRRGQRNSAASRADAELGADRPVVA